MIHLTRINRLPLVLNADLIEHLEVTPDTVISLTNGQKFVVRESADEVIERVVEFRRRIEGPDARPELAGRLTPAEHPAG
jgi:flagellar protein FlbD